MRLPRRVFSVCLFTAMTLLSACQSVSGQSNPTTESMANVDASALNDEQAETDNPAQETVTPSESPTTTGLVPTKPMKTGVLQQAELSEVSGLAASRRYPDILWAINDSGNAARIYAVDHKGQAKGDFKIAASNRDWEDLAAATINRAGAVLTAAGATVGSAVGDAGAPFGKTYIVWDDNVPSGTWSSGFTIPLQNPPGTLTTITGSFDNDHFGEELLAGADYDGDGTADLFVGDLASDGVGGREASGIGHILYNAANLAGLTFDLNTLPAGARETRIFGPSAGAIFADTAAQGDFNLDGYDDLMASSPHHSPLGRINAGAMHIFYGKAGGWPTTIDLLPAAHPTPAEALIVEVYGAEGTGPTIGDTLGYSAAAGDIDDDGRIDIITNEMVGDGLQPSTNDVGNLIILSAETVAPSADLFADGFETGDLSRWSSTTPLLFGLRWW